MPAVIDESVETNAAIEDESSEADSAVLLLATDACCQRSHLIAEVERGGGEMPVVVCITCTELWGRMQGLRNWQKHCSHCFSKSYPDGLTNLGITAQAIAAR